MSNEYFNHPNPLEAHTLSRAASLNAIFDAIVAAFDMLPTPAQAKWDAGIFAVATMPTANAYAMTPPLAPTALSAGMTFRFQAPATANTGAATLNVNAIGAVAIKRFNGAALEAEDIPASAIVQVTYDGSAFRMVGGGGSGEGSGGTVSIGDVEGLQAYLDQIGLPVYASAVLRTATDGLPTGNVDGALKALDAEMVRSRISRASLGLNTYSQMR